MTILDKHTCNFNSLLTATRTIYNKAAARVIESHLITCRGEINCVFLVAFKLMSEYTTVLHSSSLNTI